MRHDLAPEAIAELTCAEAEPLLPLVADGALDATTEPSLFAHLARCADCQDALASHDLVSLAIGRGVPAAIAPARLSVIQYRLPWPAAVAAAAAVVAAIGGSLWWRGAGADTAQPILVDREVIEVRAPGGDGTRRLYLIRAGDHIEVVDPARIDGGRSADANASATPAGFHRY